MLKTYKITLQHDKGTATITTTASSLSMAVKKIIDAEGCPENSIKRIIVKREGTK